MVMTTVINTPPANNASSNAGTNLMVTAVILFLVGALFIYFGLPLLSRMANKGVQIDVPKDINVTVEQGE